MEEFSSPVFHMNFSNRILEILRYSTVKDDHQAGVKAEICLGPSPSHFKLFFWLVPMLKLVEVIKRVTCGRNEVIKSSVFTYQHCH